MAGYHSWESFFKLAEVFKRGMPGRLTHDSRLSLLLYYLPGSFSSSLLPTCASGDPVSPGEETWFANTLCTLLTLPYLYSIFKACCSLCDWLFYAFRSLTLLTLKKYLLCDLFLYGEGDTSEFEPSCSLTIFRPPDKYNMVTQAVPTCFKVNCSGRH